MCRKLLSHASCSFGVYFDNVASLHEPFEREKFDAVPKKKSFNSRLIHEERKITPLPIGFGFSDTLLQNSVFNCRQTGYLFMKTSIKEPFMRNNCLTEMKVFNFKPEYEVWEGTFFWGGDIILTRIFVRKRNAPVLRHMRNPAACGSLMDSPTGYT